jgi:polar amino acid transport system substrate-binding protein
VQAPRFDQTTWPALIDDIKAGRRDLASGAAHTPERATFATFSKPYREDATVLILRRGARAALPALPDGAALARYLRASGFRLGVIDGFSYVDAALDAWIADAANRPRLSRSPDDAANLRRLLAGEIDGFLAERISAAVAVARGPDPRAVEEHADFRIAVPLHLMFSKATVPAETVAAFDRAIDELRAEGELTRVAGEFRLPVLISLTLNSGWFRVLEVVATISAALAGYLAARASAYSLLGALVLAVVTATGGGVMRDLLANRHPLGIMTSPLYLSLVLGTVAGAFIAGHLRNLLRARAAIGRGVAVAVEALQRRSIDRWLFETADAAALAGFAVVGVAVALATGAAPLWLWGPILGTITGAGGGILRDIIRGGGDIPNLRGSVYAEVALVWSVALSLWLERRAGAIEIDEMLLVVIVAVAGGAATRLAAVALRWRAVPLP